MSFEERYPFTERVMVRGSRMRWMAKEPVGTQLIRDLIEAFESDGLLDRLERREDGWLIEVRNRAIQLGRHNADEFQVGWWREQARFGVWVRSDQGWPWDWGIPKTPRAYQNIMYNLRTAAGDRSRVRSGERSARAYIAARGDLRGAMEVLENGPVEPVDAGWLRRAAMDFSEPVEAEPVQTEAAPVEGESVEAEPVEAEPVEDEFVREEREKMEAEIQRRADERRLEKEQQRLESELKRVKKERRKRSWWS